MLTDMNLEVNQQSAVRELTYAEELREALRQAMQNDASVFLIGEDVGIYGGAFGVTAGLVEEFGSDRVIDTPISESAIAGACAAAALRQHPLLNSYFRDEEILVLPEVSIGLAVALAEGLIVPVIHHADRKSLFQIAAEVGDLSRRARMGDLHPGDVVDGTFTISNLGMYAIDQFTAIINPPQVAILAVGRIADRFIPDESNRPILRPMMTITLSVDHRVVDGVEAACFLSTLQGILETAGTKWG